LSDSSAYEGGELYVLDSGLFDGVDMLTVEQFTDAVPSAQLRQQHSVALSCGDALLHPGRTIHGVLPVTSGKRYVLILMFRLEATTFPKTSSRALPVLPVGDHGAKTGKCDAEAEGKDKLSTCDEESIDMP
jgi:hypothetical protein